MSLNLQAGDRLQIRYSLRVRPVILLAGLRNLSPKGAFAMEWVTPQHEEIDLNCEVSSYANAEL